MLLIPIAVAAGCAYGAIYAAQRWLLPTLSDEPVAVIGGYFIVALLAGAAAVVGLDAYYLVRDMADTLVFARDRADSVAMHLQQALSSGGVLAGLAGVIYMLAPRRHGEVRDQG